MRLEIWTFVVHFFQVFGVGSKVNFWCILNHKMHQIESWRSKECMERAAENSNFDILLCKTPLFRCKSRCTEDLKWLFLDSIHLLMSKSQHSSIKLNVVFFKIHRNFQKTKIWSEMVQFEPSKVSNLGFLRIPVYFWKINVNVGLGLCVLVCFRCCSVFGVAVSNKKK